MKQTRLFKNYSAHQLFKNNKIKEDNACGHGGMLDKMYDYFSSSQF